MDKTLDNVDKNTSPNVKGVYEHDVTFVLDIVRMTI